MKTYERFLEYVAFDTQSKEDSASYPSTEKQWLLAKRLLKDLQKMGVAANVDEFGYVIGKIPANTQKKTPKMALIAHIDTSPDASGGDIKARIVPHYDGKPILLNAANDMVLSPEVFPSLKNKIGHDLIVTDGTTLLGADDKAGVAEIMAIAGWLTADPSIPHGEIIVVFTPDEEVGNGTKYIDIKKIGADFAYTLDGSIVGEIAYENFNAAAAKVTISGHSVHPGSAKGKMVNSLRLGLEFDALLPQFMRPEFTEMYEGFNHLHGMEGTCEKTVLKYLIRNHDRALFAQQKRDFENARDFMNQKYRHEFCKVEITDSYFNMREELENSLYIVDLAKEAIREVGVMPFIEPIRGGTDGARLTYLGLPCPNLGTGGYNYHGPYEYLSIQEMDQSVEIVKRIVLKVAKMEKNRV